MNTKTLEELVAVLGPEALPTQAVKAMRNGTATPEGVDIVLRSRYLPKWREICDLWMKGDLFSAQRLGWEQWSTSYSEAQQRMDKARYELAWTAAHCCGEEHGGGWKAIERFYSCRVEDRYQVIPRKAFVNLKPEQREKVRQAFFKQDADNGWGWGR